MGEPQSGLGAVMKKKCLPLSGFEQLVQPVAYSHDELTLQVTPPVSSPSWRVTIGLEAQAVCAADVSGPRKCTWYMDDLDVMLLQRKEKHVNWCSTSR
jgi:hypothetical protein